MKWQDVLPILASIVVIILVAIFERQSKLVAAITATMPLTAPLALWVVYASVDGDRTSMVQFSLGLLLGSIPTLGFLAIAWLAARAGLKLAPILLFGYGVWAIGLLAIIGLRRMSGL
jgi:hypothetical protein